MLLRKRKYFKTLIFVNRRNFCNFFFHIFLYILSLYHFLSNPHKIQGQNCEVCCHKLHTDQESTYFSLSLNSSNHLLSVNPSLFSILRSLALYLSIPATIFFLFPPSHPPNKPDPTLAHPFPFPSSPVFDMHIYINIHTHKKWGPTMIRITFPFLFISFLLFTIIFFFLNYERKFENKTSRGWQPWPVAGCCHDRSQLDIQLNSPSHFGTRPGILPLPSISQPSKYFLLLSLKWMQN